MITTIKMKKTIQLLAIAIMAIYACGCNSSSKVKGQVYVIMNSGNSVKMAGVQVFLIEETTLRNRFNELSKDGGFVEPALKLAKDTATKAHMTVNFFTLMLLNPETKGFRNTTTGADGDFSFEHIPEGRYLLYARGSRDVLEKTEYYVWLRKFSVKDGYTYTADLQNDFNLLTDSTMQPIVELVVPDLQHPIAFVPPLDCLCRGNAVRVWHCFEYKSSDGLCVGTSDMLFSCF